MSEARKHSAAAVQAALVALGVEAFGGRVQVRWNHGGAATPFGQRACLAEFLNLTRLYRGWVRSCPLRFASPNGSRIADVLNMLVLLTLSGIGRLAAGMRSHHSSAMALVRIGSIAAFFGVCASVSAQPYPSKVVRWIVPHGAGGGSDMTARAVAQRLSDLIGYPVVVDNRTGASGNIGAELATRAPADGYTLVTISASHPVSHAIAERMSYDLMGDFAYVTQMTRQPYILVVHPSIAAKSVSELIAVVRAAPGTFQYGTAGVGTLQHLAGVMFGAMGGSEIFHVPYKSAAVALMDTIAGRLQVMFVGILPSIPHIQTGRIRALAVTSTTRTPTFPDLPTIAESGLKDYVVNNWYGIAVPAQTPRPVITKLHSELVRALKSPEVKARFHKDGSESVGNSPEEFAAIVRDDLQRWRKYVKKAGIKPDS